MKENQELKRQNRLVEASHQQELVTFREQNTRLMQQLKAKQHSDLTMSKPTTGEWVHVHHSQSSVSNIDTLKLLIHSETNFQKRLDCHRQSLFHCIHDNYVSIISQKTRK